MPIRQYRLIIDGQKVRDCRTKRISSKFGPTVLPVIGNSQSTTIQGFLTNPYSAVIPDTKHRSFTESRIQGNM